MATFGNTTGTGYTYGITAGNSYLRAWGGAPASDGTADSITIKTGSTVVSACDFQCAIYEYDSSTDIGNLIALTGIVSVSTTNTEYTFNFSAPKPSLTNGTNYYLCVGCVTKPDGSERTRLVADTTTGSMGSVTYAGAPCDWADPMTGEAFTALNLYIYCTYTETVIPIDIPNDSFLNSWYYKNQPEQYLNVDGW
jgi:hypothetical protein